MVVVAGADVVVAVAVIGVRVSAVHGTNDELRAGAGPGGDASGWKAGGEVPGHPLRSAAPRETTF